MATRATWPLVPEPTWASCSGLAPVRHQSRVEGGRWPPGGPLWSGWEWGPGCSDREAVRLLSWRHAGPRIARLLKITQEAFVWLLLKRRSFLLQRTLRRERSACAGSRARGRWGQGDGRWAMGEATGLSRVMPSVAWERHRAGDRWREPWPHAFPPLSLGQGPLCDRQMARWTAGRGGVLL